MLNEEGYGIKGMRVDLEVLEVRKQGGQEDQNLRVVLAIA